MYLEERSARARAQHEITGDHPAFGETGVLQEDADDSAPAAEKA
jgi:hypothetical protein